MIRGILSIFSLFALSLWISIFFTGAVPGILFPLVGLAFLAVSIPIASTENPRWKQAAAMLSFLGLGLLIGSLRSPEMTGWDRYPRLFPASPAHTAVPLHQVGGFTGILSADSVAVPDTAGTLSRYPIRLKQVASLDGQRSGSASGNVLVWIRNGPMLFRGQEVTVYAALDRSEQPGRFAYTSWAETDRLQGGAFPRRIDSLRAGIFIMIHTSLQRLDPSVAALMRALLLGRREELEFSLYEQFRTSGSLHLLALSGLHLGILYLLLCLLLRFFRDKRLRRLIAGGLLLGYVFLVGWRPSLERAAVMLLIAAAGYTLDREIQPLNLLGLAAAVLLLVHPYYAFDLSFQLSFLSLAAIILLSPYLHRIWQGYLPAFLGWPLAVSLSAQIGTAPLVMYYFGAIYPVGAAAALLLIPLVTVFLGGGVLFVGLSFLSILPGGVPPGGALSGPVSDLIADGLLLVYRSIALCLDLFSRPPGVYVSWRSVYWLFLAILLLPFAIEAWTRKRIPSC
jgi:ComEC/Rec2-related protein